MDQARDNAELLALQAEHSRAPRGEQRMEDALIVARGHLAAAQDRALSMTTTDAELAERLRVRAARRSDDAQWFARKAVVS